MRPLSATDRRAPLTATGRTISNAATRVTGARRLQTRCGSPAWVPVALALLDVGRRLLAEIDARSGCETKGRCAR